MGERNHVPDVDALDLSLMRELEINPAQSQKTLAGKLGVNRVTVASRIQRLVDSGTVRMICYVDPVALGFSYYANLGIVTQPGKNLEVAEQIAACEPVNAVILCTGSFGVTAYVTARNQNELLRFLSDEIEAIPGIQHMETLVTLQTVKNTASLLSDGKEVHFARGPVQDIDATDLALMARLQNGIQKTADLAAGLGISKATVIRRIRRLEKTGIIRFAAEIDPIALGYKGAASIYMKFDPAHVKEAARMIASYRNIRYVGIMAGRYDVVAWILFRELGDLRHFLTEELVMVPGLRETETMINLKLVKYSYRLLPDHLKPAAPGLE